MKKFIANIIIKKIRKLDIGTCTNRRQTRYLFYRWLAEVFKNPNTINVRKIIADYIMTEYHSLSGHFEDIFVLNNVVFILTRRPGMWIGKCGNTVDTITNNINTVLLPFNGKKYNIEFVEELGGAVTDVADHIKLIRAFRDEDY